MSTVNVTFTVEHHDEVTDQVHPAGSTADVDRHHASNLVYRGLARHTLQTPAPAPAAAETATSAAKQSKGKE